MGAKEEILGRVRKALQDVPASEKPDDLKVEWQYGQPLGTKDVLADLVEKVEDYGATVVQVEESGVQDALLEALRKVDAKDVVLPSGLPQQWADAVNGADFSLHTDEPQLSHEKLNEIDTVITTCAVAMADSGTIALDHGPGQGRRALSLVPDKHVCVVRADQVVSDVPEGVARLRDAVDDRRPITWISGGSATSDIELSRVEGVHGPRTLYVILVTK
ncbi:MAG: lactate utilization protein C [Propionibacteriaceae bacterium]|nr:lactate utilization protein C [Propionibacteriaceae bacterium]